MNIYQIKISLDGAKPSIYRTVLVKPNTSFYEFHHIIQIAMGWDTYHLYQFETGDFYISEPDEFRGTESIDPNDIVLSEVLKEKGDKVKYEYDFGDRWRHTILLEKIIPYQLNKSYPACIRGKRSCPPDDCGGIWGYEDLKDVLADKKHPEHREMLEWVGADFDPDEFDIEFVNEMFTDFDLYMKEELEQLEEFGEDFLEEREFNDEEEDSAKAFKNHLFNVINEQMDENDPPEAAATFKRLLNTDFSHLEAKLLLIQCLSHEMISIVTEGKSFNMNRYIKNLKKLPKINFDK